MLNERTMIQVVILVVLNVNTKIVTTVHKRVILKASDCKQMAAQVFKNINHFHIHILSNNYKAVTFLKSGIQHINDKNIIF